MTPGAERYRIQGLLGRGGFGAVYQAEFLGEGGFTKTVALKVLRPTERFAAEVEQRLRDEARMLGLLRHRGIVQVDRLIHLDPRWVVVMEYVEGFDLREALGVAPLPPTVALELAAEVAGALHVAFTHPGPDGPLRLLHRDIKPGNVRITPYGDVKVLDFGIARAEFASREARTQNISLGSPDYMAPERFALQDSPAGDVYSVGVLLWESLVQKRLGRTRPQELHHAQKMGQALGRLRSLPPEIAQLVAEATSYEPEDRPSARDFERRARRLARKLEGPMLADWAEEVLPRIEARRKAKGPLVDHDRLLGSTLEVVGGAGHFELPEPETTGAPPLATTRRTLPPEPPTPTPAPQPEGEGHALPLALGAAALLLALAGVATVVLQGQAARDAPSVEEPAPNAEVRLETEAEAAQAPATQPTAPEVATTVEREEPVASNLAKEPPPRPVRSPPELLQAVPVEEDPEQEPEPPQHVQVDLRGDATWAELRRGDTAVRLPGKAEPGTWQVVAAFPDSAPESYLTIDLQVPATVDCQAMLRSCALR